jgi:hypothetical protein
MTTCPSGTYREGWLLQSDPKADSCTPCGEGISSEPRDLDQNPLVAEGSLVRATSASCCKSDTLMDWGIAWTRNGLLQTSMRCKLTQSDSSEEVLVEM